MIKDEFNSSIQCHMILVFVENVLHYSQKFGVSKTEKKLRKMKKVNAFIHQGRIKLITTDSKDIYNVTKDFHFK